MVDTEHKATNNVARQPKAIPVYAFRIRELRDAYGLTQKQLAIELKAARISVARWETGTRAPSKQNYQALAEMAERKGLQPLKDFFCSQIEAKERSKQTRAEERNALRELQSVINRMEGGDDEADRLITLAASDPTDYAKEQLAEILKAREELKNGEFSTRLSEIATEASRVNQLRLAMALKMRRRMEKIDRQVDELLARRKEIVGASEALRREIGQISLAWREAKQESPEIIDSTVGVVEHWSKQIERKLSRLKKKGESGGQK